MNVMESVLVIRTEGVGKGLYRQTQQILKLGARVDDLVALTVSAHGQVHMAKAVTAYLPASSVQRADLFSIHISIDAHVVVNDIGAGCEPVFLQDRESIGKYRFAAIIKRQDDRFVG